MQTLGQTRWGMPCLAIMHSVPVASLLWSYVIQHMVASTPLDSYVSRTTLFSTALAIQIFGPKDHVTIATLGIECLVLILFWLLGGVMMQQFCRTYDEEYRVDGDDSDEKISSSKESQHDVEEGLDK